MPYLHGHDKKPVSVIFSLIMTGDRLSLHVSAEKCPTSQSDTYSTPPISDHLVL